MVNVLHSAENRDLMQQTLSELSNQGIEKLLELCFLELRGRGVRYGLDGPYSAWDPKWGADSVGILEIRASKERYTIQPTPNPRSVP